MKVIPNATCPYCGGAFALPGGRQTTVTVVVGCPLCHRKVRVTVGTSAPKVERLERPVHEGGEMPANAHPKQEEVPK